MIELSVELDAARSEQATMFVRSAPVGAGEGAAYGA